ncbi:hypothetical protein J2X03_002782 [Microbacterium trichothecenolyticum]|uniref:hypothetical protein n=1 Tax=Microbacterium trichothecenolyticum TaxID=69370 RepID=UPI0028607353|nr:hypothetical protein [Microbacterium trichothecenolyticum]MDR7112885.1 hypothetical protein [Microbacterium trichothecenolyticum]
MLNDTTGSRGFRTLDRRTLLRTGAWAAPAVVVAAAAPAASASPVNPVLRGAFTIYSNGVNGNVFAHYASGNWETDNYVQITIVSAGGVLGTPTAGDLTGWQLIQQSATAATLQCLTSPNSNDWTSPFLRWVPFTAAPLPRSISIDGRILGTTASGFADGPIVGPQ